MNNNNLFLDDFICHVAESESCIVSAFHGWRNTLFSVFIISLQIQRFDKTKRKYILHSEENNIRNIFCVLIFELFFCKKNTS